MRAATLRSTSILLAAAAPLAALHGAPYEDVTASSGLEFVHTNGMHGDRLLPEIMGSGVGLIDYDGDGDLDVYLVDGRGFGVRAPTPHDRLYRNDGGDPLRFTEVSVAVGLDRYSDYGMGVSVGDFDGDGHDDLYLTNLGPNRLLRNTGPDGGYRFEDVTAAWGAEDDRLSVSSVFFDMDGDGDLDLYSGNYVAWSEAAAKPCRSATSARDYCSPKVYPPQPDRLLRNDGDRYTNVTAGAGLTTAFGPALGVIAADFDGDGRTDLFVANDGAANQLWLNQGPSPGGLTRFVDDGPLAGVALNMDGIAEASMGVDAGDVDDDGDLDLFMTHLATETNTLYLNEGDGWFEDRTATMGLASASLPATGFGTALTDYDGDGLLDLLAVNGGVMSIAEQLQAGEELPLRMANQLFRNLGGGRYQDVSASAGEPFRVMEISRGLAMGDLDGDGDEDAVLTNNAGPARVLLNRAADGATWIGVDLREAAGNSHASAWVRFDCAALPPRWRRASRDGSYASSGDPRATLFLGDAEVERCDLDITWNDGSRSEHPGLATGRYHRIQRPAGS